MLQALPHIAAPIPQDGLSVPPVVIIIAIVAILAIGLFGFRRRKR